jgi:pyruvate kinase
MLPESRRETRTKIVATLGPASWDEPMLSRLIETGVDVCRINCSHTDADGIRRQVARVRRAAGRIDHPVAILLDLQGPKIRIGKVNEPIELGIGDVLTVVMSQDFVQQGRRVGTTYPEMANDVKAGDVVLFADGTVGGRVEEVRRNTSPAEVDVRIDIPGTLTSFKGLNLPGVLMSVPCLTEKDLRDVEVGMEVGVDYVALSFVQRAADVVELRGHLERLGRPVPIVAKIEKPQAVEAIGDIVKVTEAVMVARGDLGVEVSIERVPVYQKHIIETAFRAGATVITATQMLDSMERNPRPTRAETTDIANAILDGTDAVMLSGETSTGKYPIEAVRTMDRIARDVEASRFFRATPSENLPKNDGPGPAIWTAACVAARERHRPLVVFTWSGESARFVSKARLHAPVFALTPHQQVVDQLAMVWGVTPIRVPPVRTTDDLIATGEQVLLQRGLVQKGEEMVIVTGETPLKGATNMMKIARAGE